MDCSQKHITQKNNGLLNKILIREISKKNSIPKSNSDGIAININENNKLIPKFLDTDNIKKSNSNKSTDSFYSSSTDLSENSPKSFIKSVIMNELELEYSNTNDSEIITNPTNITLNLKSDNTNMEDNNIRKCVSTSNIYDLKSDDLLIMSNLTFLSIIKPHQKIIIKNTNNNNNNKINFEFEIDNSFIPNITRWYYKQGRNETINSLNILIDVSIEQLNIHKNFNNIVEIANYKNLLEKSLFGLNNLKETYKTDSKISSQLDTIISKITNIIKKNLL